MVDKKKSDPEVVILGDVDDFADLYGDGSDNVVVELYRVAPKFVGAEPVGGFLDALPPGATRAYIAEKYGGGRLRLTRKRNGICEDNRFIDIVGNPIPVRRGSPAPAADVAPAVPPVSGDGVKYEGFELGGDDQRLFRQLKQLMLVKSVIDQNSPNNQLLTALLDRRPSGGLETLKELAPIVAMVKELFVESSASEGSSAGSNWVDVIRDVAKAFAQVVAARSGAGAALPFRAPVTGPPPGLAAGAISAVPNLLSSPERSPLLTFSDYLSQGVEVIVGAYQLHKAPANVANVLASVIPLSSAIKREKLAPYRETFFDSCETTASLQWPAFAEDESERAHFRAFFDEVFEFFLGVEPPSIV